MFPLFMRLHPSAAWQRVASEPRPLTSQAVHSGVHTQAAPTRAPDSDSVGLGEQTTTLVTPWLPPTDLAAPRSRRVGEAALGRRVLRPLARPITRLEPAPLRFGALPRRGREIAGREANPPARDADCPSTSLTYPQMVADGKGGHNSRVNNNNFPDQLQGRRSNCRGSRGISTVSPACRVRRLT